MSPASRLAIYALLLALAAPAAAAPTHYLGVNTHLPGVDVLDGVKDLGMSWIRIDVNWLEVQPSAAAPPDFSAIDAVVAEAQKRGLKVFATLAYAPAWASEPDTDGKGHNNVPKAGEYQKFCQAAAAHFKNSVTHLGTWNEPNLKDFFEGTRQQWIDRIAIEGIKGIKAGCPACLALGPELASIGSGYDVWLDDALKQLKKAGLMWDAITWHIYSGFFETKLGGWNCWDGDLFQHDLDEQRVCFGIPSGAQPVRQVLVANGVASVPVWITETGYTAALGDGSKLATQVTYYRRVIEEQLKRPWWTHTFFYEIVDDNNIPDKWGMGTRTGAPTFPQGWTLKPVWSYVKKVLSGATALGGSGDACHDSLDNDADKKIDALGLDADGDKQIDVAPDPECAGGATSESPVPKLEAGSLKDRGPWPASDARFEAGLDQAVAAADLQSGADVDAIVDPPPKPGSSSGCGCAVGESPSLSLLTLLLLLVALATRRARR